MDKYIVNIALGGRHWARVELNTLNVVDAEAMAQIIRLRMGGDYVVTLTRWSAPMGTEIALVEKSEEKPMVVQIEQRQNGDRVLYESEMQAAAEIIAACERSYEGHMNAVEIRKVIADNFDWNPDKIDHCVASLNSPRGMGKFYMRTARERHLKKKVETRA